MGEILTLGNVHYRTLSIWWVSGRTSEGVEYQRQHRMIEAISD